MEAVEETQTEYIDELTSIADDIVAWLLDLGGEDIEATIEKWGELAECAVEAITYYREKQSKEK